MTIASLTFNKNDELVDGEFTKDSAHSNLSKGVLELSFMTPGSSYDILESAVCNESVIKKIFRFFIRLLVNVRS